MRPGFAIVALSASAFGCRNGGGATPPPPPPPVVVDAAPPPDGITALGSYNPQSGLHLDDDAPVPKRGTGTVAHAHRTLEILLRSTPSGATVAVDGVVVGQTPGYWEGDFTGREREFTFVMPGYAMARYRFVPTTNGVVHGRLTKLAPDQVGRVPEIPKPTDPSTSLPSASAPPAPAPPARPVAPPPPPSPVQAVAPPPAPPDAAPAAAPTGSDVAPASSPTPPAPATPTIDGGPIAP